MTRMLANPNEQQTDWARPSDPDPQPPALLLASRSPRRRHLLDEAGISHLAVHPGFEDGVLTPGAGATPAQWVASLAYLKAWGGVKLADAMSPGPRLVLGADTACLVHGNLVGTPTSADEAMEMLWAMREGTHEVLTGVAIIDRDAGTRTVFVDTAQVRVGELGRADVEAYVASGDWQGKAGGYNLAERMDAGWPLACEGDPTTVMGLPMRRLTLALEGLGVRARRRWN